jgi:hypothetical protein
MVWRNRTWKRMGLRRFLADNRAGEVGKKRVGRG